LQTVQSQSLTEPEWIFPFQGMDVGDSFFIPTVKPAILIYIVDSRAKAYGIRVKAYTSSKEGHLGVRVWRVG
jgi:hypothetical protein